MREMSWDKELGQVSSPSNQMNNSDQKNKSKSFLLMVTSTSK